MKYFQKMIILTVCVMGVANQCQKHTNAPILTTSSAPPSTTGEVFRFIISQPYEDKDRYLCLYDVLYYVDTNKTYPTLITSHAVTKTQVAENLQNNFQPKDSTDELEVLIKAINTGLGALFPVSALLTAIDPETKKFVNIKNLGLAGGVMFLTSFIGYQNTINNSNDNAAETVIKEQSAQPTSQQTSQIFIQRISSVTGEKQFACPVDFNLQLTRSGVYGGEMLQLQVENTS